MLKPKGKSLKAYNQGKSDRRKGVKKEDNPWLSVMATGAQASASWWNTGWLHADTEAKS